VLIEQAKGVLSERGHIEPGEAFTRLRAHARGTHQRLSELARGVIDGTLDTTTLLS
jgi:AmiR/NasT family two-component response regulator